MSIKRRAILLLESTTAAPPRIRQESRLLFGVIRQELLELDRTPQRIQVRIHGQMFGSEAFAKRGGDQFASAESISGIVLCGESINAAD
ncbi:MAG: hypothetical protein U0791_27910, partial [Gemmataceae bacterium]